MFQCRRGDGGAGDTLKHYKQLQAISGDTGNVKQTYSRL